MKSLDPTEEIICTFYRHHNGYPEGHGADLAKWLDGKKLVNGITLDQDRSITFNRAGTMAVQLMAYIQKISGCEVLPTGSKDCGEEYIYDIYFRDNEFWVLAYSVYDDDATIRLL